MTNLHGIIVDMILQKAHESQKRKGGRTQLNDNTSSKYQHTYHLYRSIVYIFQLLSQTTSNGTKIVYKKKKKKKKTTENEQRTTNNSVNDASTSQERKQTKQKQTTKKKRKENGGVRGRRMLYQSNLTLQKRNSSKVKTEF